MSNPWKKVAAPADVQNLSDIMSEQFAKGLQIKEEIKFAEEIGTAFQSDEQISSESNDISPEILKQIEESKVKEFCDSDAIIAKVLQCQFDKEYDDEIKRVEKKRNGEAKVSVSYENYRHVPDHLVYDSESDDEDVEISSKKDWDRFETNEKEFASLPKRGFIMKDGAMVTKHIMSEQFAKGLQIKEEIKFAEEIGTAFQSDEQISSESNDISPEILKQIEESKVKEFCDSDAIIAKVLQCQFDKEYDDEIKRVEKKRNGEAKVSVSYENYRHVPDHLVFDSESDDEDVEISSKKDWDRFETNEKEFASLPKRGFIMKDGAMVTKHDSVINGRRNACKVMAFPPEVCTGDGAGFDMKLSNSVFNHLRKSTRHHQSRKHKMLDRKESHATAEMGLDEPTRLILFQLINNGLLEDINGVISTGKESVVLHANGDTSYPDLVIPKECAIKVFKTTLNEFKTRDKYIEADYRFKDRFSKQNPRKIVHMWAEKEMHNMMRMQKIGLNCPNMILLKKHILLMSFIGRDNKSAPKLRDVILKPEKWQSVYNEVVEAMHKLYNVGHMIHADLSEYNILWWENKCWFIDVSQSVQPDHPNGLEFLLRDCRNICNFFEKKGVTKMKSVDELFKSITGFDEVDVNLLEGVHTTYNSLSSRFEIALDDNRNTSYPFEYCWQKTNEGKQIKSDDSNEEDEFEEMWTHAVQKKVDTAANFGNVVEIDTEKIDDKKATTERAGTSVVDKKVNFANELEVNQPVDEGIDSSKHKKS